MDEKTQLPTLERLHPGHPPIPGRPARLAVHSRRHGTLAVLAELAVRSGQVVVRVRWRRRPHEFLELLQALCARWPRDRLVIVLDNLSIRTTPTVQSWLRPQRGRVRFAFPPFDASWLQWTFKGLPFVQT